METYNNLDFIASKDKLIGFLSKIRESLPESWVYKKTNSDKYSKNTSKSVDEVLCVESPEIKSNKGLIWLGFWEEKLRVINIVPAESGHLSYDEYNSILDKFYEDCITPNVDENVTVLYETSGIDIVKEAGQNTFDKMEDWESCCNHGTGNTHPMDFKRWAEFVITAHREDSKLTADLFQRWLVEEKGWSLEYEITNRLVLDYEYSRELLKENDNY